MSSFYKEHTRENALMLRVIQACLSPSHSLSPLGGIVILSHCLKSQRGDKQGGRRRWNRVTLKEKPILGVLQLLQNSSGARMCVCVCVGRKTDTREVKVAKWMRQWQERNGATDKHTPHPTSSLTQLTETHHTRIQLLAKPHYVTLCTTGSG